MAVGLIIVIIVAVALLVIILAGWYIGTYNAFIALKLDIPRTWSNIDVILKQRYDELPNLVSSVKGYMKHEKDTLEELTKSRTDWIKAKTMQQKAKVSEEISAALKTIFAVAENYPQLKANENVKQLMERISGLENELADRREFYNDSVTTFNTRTKQFPALIVAKTMGLKETFELFKATAEESKTVEVKI
jgi:LemA protein